MPITRVKPYQDFTQAFVVPSTSVHKATHLVAQNRTGEWVCSCPHFVFRAPAQGCKHIARVLAWQAKNPPVVLQLPATTNRFAGVDV